MGSREVESAIIVHPVDLVSGIVDPDGRMTEREYNSLPGAQVRILTSVSGESVNPIPLIEIRLLIINKDDLFIYMSFYSGYSI